jgi:CRP-like cAMP-binding protein
MRTIANSKNMKSKIILKKSRRFDAQAFLDSAGVARRVKDLKKEETVYSQGDAAESVLYLQKGAVKLSVVNEVGKEAVVAILGPGDFFGEGCLGASPFAWGRLPQSCPLVSSSLRRVKC